MYTEESFSQRRVLAAVNKAVDNARRAGVDVSHEPYEDAARHHIVACPLCRRAAAIAAEESEAGWPVYPALALALSWRAIISAAGGGGQQ